MSADSIDCAKVHKREIKPDINWLASINEK